MMSWTGSIQTVCQMPVTPVYQMPLGSRRCLPTGGFSPLAASVVLGGVPALPGTERRHGLCWSHRPSTEPPMSAQLPPATGTPAESLVTTAHVAYALHTLGLVIGAFGTASVIGAFLFGWPSIIAVINLGVVSDPELVRSTVERMEFLKVVSGGYKRERWNWHCG